MTRRSVVLFAAAALGFAPAAAQTPPAPAGKPDPARSGKEKKDEPKKRAARPRARIETAHGPVEIELYPEEAPKTVANFVALARRGFYNGLTFHRVEPGFVVQGGDPKGDGTGGPGYTIPNETNRVLKHVRGAVGMANSGKDTAGSQFYIVIGKEAPALDNGLYTLFGQVVAGQEAAEKIQVGDRIEAIRVELPAGYRPAAIGPSRRAEPEALAFPDLPEDALRRDFARTVRVRVQIGAEGGTGQAILLRGSGDAEIDRAIAEAIAAWRWSPAMRSGEPVASVQEFEYDLNTRSRRYDNP